MNTVFIQFYSKIDRPYGYELGNGFSDTYDLCKSKGDLIWMEHVHDYLDNVEFSSDFPIKKGTAYISASYLSHLSRATIWAKENQDVKFIVGGPVITTGLVTESETPNNLTVTKKSVEEWFGVENFSNKWYLDIPSVVLDTDWIIFSYTLDNVCYWRKCIFCTFMDSRHVPLVRERENMNCEFKNIKRKGKMVIRLGTEAISAKKIPIVMNSLPYDDRVPYRVFMRPTLGELNSLKTVKDKISIIKFRMGLEFPGTRMWNFLKKGFKEDTVLDILNLLHDNNSKSLFSMVLGWNNLEDSDLIELENFMKKVPGSDGCAATIHRLFAFPGTDVFKNNEIGKNYYSGEYYLGFVPKLKKEQIELNKKAKEIITHYIKEKNFSLTDLCNLEED